MWPSTVDGWLGLFGLTLLMLLFYVGGVLLLAACIGLGSSDE